MIKVTIKPVERERIADKMIVSAGLKAEKVMEEAGQDMVKTVQRYVSNRYERRDGHQRKKNSQFHLEEAFAYKVIRGPKRGGFPWRVELGLRDEIGEDSDDAIKVGALNWPTKKASYTIKAKNAPKLVWNDKSGVLKSATQVEWRRKPGSQFSRGRFMQDARDVVVRRLRNRKL